MTGQIPENHALRRRRSDPERINRLVGGRNIKGGGLPLPDVFRAAVRRLLDNGPTPHYMMVKIIKASISRLQEKRVLSIWDTWEEFAGDILDQLTDAGLMFHDEDGWQLIPGFTPLRHYVIIPRTPDGRGGTWIAVGTGEGERRQDAAGESVAYAGRIRKLLDGTGLLTPELDASLTQIIMTLQDAVPREVRAARGSIAPPGEKTRNGSVDEPGDEPGTWVQCWGNCKKSKPLTREYYEVYFSKSGNGRRAGHPGMYYWRRDCRECHAEMNRNRLEARRDRVRQVILAIVREGEPLTAENISQRTHMNIQDADRHWGWLAKREENIPGRPPDAPRY